MANVFGIITAIALALSAFIAYKNKAAYEGAITETQSRQSELANNQKKLKAQQATLVALPEERAGVEAEVEKLTASEAATKKANDGLKAQSETATAKIAANKQKLDAIREKTAKTGDLQELSSKMRTTNAELEELGQSITQSEAKLANLTAQNTAAEGNVAANKSKFDNYTNGQSLPSMKTTIRSIYPNWGFVTLAAGNGAGVVANSTLNVIRDEKVVARLLVTAVETNTASATIVPDSLSSDTTLAIGDQVVPGAKAEKLTKN